jgi:polyhydroxyalkanoate synthase
LEGVAANQRIRTPLLICYALVNRPSMMDLQPDRSLIRGLLQRGLDVYLIDWGYPDGADRYLGVADYVLGYLANCVDFLRQSTGHEQINLLGVCQGGTLSLCYSALHRERVRNLIAMVTPVDFRTPQNLLTKWTEHVDLDALIATTGNVPGAMLNNVFLALMPFRLMSQKYADMLDQVHDPKAMENFLRMEKWIFDSPDLPGEVFRQFVKDCYQENKLIRNRLEVGGQRVDLKKITMPLLNIYGRFDHLVPPEACEQLTRHVGSTDTEDACLETGHIGIYVSSKVQREFAPRIAAWLKARDLPPGEAQPTPAGIETTAL